MMTAMLFENGRSQAVRLPKECRFSGNEVAVSKMGDLVILMPKDKGAQSGSGGLDRWKLFCDEEIDGEAWQDILERMEFENEGNE